MELKGKRIVFLGDSITESWGASSEFHAFHQIIKREYELDLACNCGVGGTKIAQRKSPCYDATKFDFYFALRAQVMPRDVDMVVVFGGTNDFGHGGIDFGSEDSNDNYTFNGALNNLINQLKRDYPNKPIIFLTPLHRADEHTVVEINNHTLKDYAYCVIKATQRHNIHLIDLFNEIDLDPTDPNLVPDGLHPNDNGHRVLADFISKKLIEL